MKLVALTAILAILAGCIEIADETRKLDPYQIEHLKQAVTDYCYPILGGEDNRDLSLSIIHIYFPDIPDNRICSDLLIEIE